MKYSIRQPGYYGKCSAIQIGIYFPLISCYLYLYSDKASIWFYY